MCNASRNVGNKLICYIIKEAQNTNLNGIEFIFEDFSLIPFSMSIQKFQRMSYEFLKTCFITVF